VANLYSVPSTCVSGVDQKYTVIYNGNGNTGGLVPTDPLSPYCNDCPATILGNTGSLTKTGRRFAGWNTAVDGTGTTYAVDVIYCGNGNLTLYAVWL
jgi:hypothetical protein